MDKYHCPLLPDCFYHIYNRGNNGDNIFYKQENYRYFLQKLDEHLSEYIDVFAYCLLPNHFHLLVRIKDESAINDAYKRHSISQRNGMSDLAASEIVSEIFRRFIIGYSKAINKQENRTGSLFQKNFKRKWIENESYLIRCVAYIHLNPQLHGIIESFQKYEWSSYNRILIPKKTKLQKDEILKWFNGQNQYQNFHCDYISEINTNYVIENE